MAIKGSGSSLSFSEIEAEFGANGSRSLGSYRLTQNVGSLSNLPLDSGIPTSGTIKFSNFYSKRLNVVVDCFSGGEETRKIAKNDKWNNNQVTVIGGFRSKKEGGSKIIINVNKKFCSNKDTTTRCALRTGSWDGSSTVQVDVGSSGRILGSGGDGGRGQNGIDGSAQAGFTGTSGLGIEVNNCTVNIASGGIIRAGFGGVVQVLKPLVVVAVAVVIMPTKHLVDLEGLVDRHKEVQVEDKVEEVQMVLP